MRIAFAIVSLFLGGGLQRDCLAVARILHRRGHEVAIFTARIVGPGPRDVRVEMLPKGAWTNHGRNLRFASDLAKAADERFDLIVGFDKLSGLDLLYCADPCIAGRHGLRRLTPRYRALRWLEAACFAKGKNTRIIALSAPQIEAYRLHWGTELERISLLPPNIEIERRCPAYRVDGTRERQRAELGVTEGDWVWLAIGGQPRTKGFDRAIAALPSFSAARLFIVGVGASDPAARPLLKLARKLGVGDRVSLLGFSDEEIPGLMAAADLLLHPARADTTGKVILEALVNGLPVVTTAVCGYAMHVRNADAGIVVPEPFEQRSLLIALQDACEEERTSRWSRNGACYGEKPELYFGLEAAADLILAAAGSARRHSVGKKLDP